MAQKTYIDGGKKAIAYHNDKKPLRVYIDGEVQTDISCVSQEISGEGSVAYESEYKKNLLSIKIQGNTVQDGTPSIDSPIPIQNTGDNGVSIKIRGKNLCDLDYLYAHQNDNFSGGYGGPKIYVGKGNYVSVSIEEALPLGLGFYFAVSYGIGSAGANSDSSKWLYHSTNSSLCKQSVTFIATEDYIYINCSSASKLAKYAGYLQIEISEAPTKYEPYVEPVTVSVPSKIGELDVKMAGIGYTDGAGDYIEVRDELEINWIYGFYVYAKRVLCTPVADLIKDDYSNITINSQYNYVSISDIPPTSSNFAAVCSHIPIWKTGGNEGSRFEVNIFSNTLDITNVQQTTVEEFKQWCVDNNVNIAYALQQPIMDGGNIITELSELNNYTQNQTNIIEVISEISPSDLKVMYAKWGGDVND